jgi:hypothetical protein
MISKIENGHWRVDIQPGGRGHKRIRKTCKAKVDAVRFERWALSQHDAGTLGPHLDKDKRRLSDLVKSGIRI